MAQKELSLKLNFEPEVNQAKAQAAGDKLNKAFAGVTVEPEIKQTGKSDSSFKSFLSKIQNMFKTSGKKSGEEFGKGIDDGIKPQLKKTAGSFSILTKGLKDAFSKGQKEASQGAGLFGNLASTVGSLVSPIGLATAAFGLFASTATAAFTEFRALDKEVQNIGTLGVANFREFAGLATDLSRSVPESASKIAGATYQAISAGIQGTNQEIIGFVEQASKVAVAGLSTTEEAVNGLTSVLNSYKLGVNDTQKVSDTFFAAIKLGKTTFNELNGAVATVVPTASAAGVGFDEVAAAISQMTALGVPTAQASTQLRSAMVELQKPTGELAKFMDSLGLSTKDIQGKLKNQGLIATLQELEGEATKSGKSFNLMFGSQEAGSAAALLTGENAKRASETLAGVRKEIESGVSTKAYEEAAKGIDVQLKIIGNNVQAGFNDAFEAIKPAAEKGLQFIIKWFEGIWEFWKAGLIEPLKQYYAELYDNLVVPIKEAFNEIFGTPSDSGLKFVDVMKAIGKVAGTLLTIAITPLRLGFQAVGNVIKFVAGVITLAKDIFKQQYNTFAIFRTVVDGIGDAFKAVGGAISAAYEYVADFFSALGAKPKAPFKEIAKESSQTTIEVKKLSQGIDETLNKEPGTDNKKTVTSLRDMRKEIESLQRTNSAFLRTLANQGIKIVSERELANLREKHTNEIEEIERQKEEYRNAKDISNKDKSALETELNAKIANVQKSQSLERIKVVADLAKKELEEERKLVVDKSDYEVLILNERLKLVQGVDERSINERYELRRQLITKNLQREIDEVLRADKEYAAAQSKVKELEISDAGTVELGNAKSRLLEKQNQLLLTNEQILLLQKASNIESLNNAGEFQQALSQFNISNIANQAVRERELTIFNARKTYEERLKIVKGNKDAELEAFLQFQSEKLIAEQSYLDKSTSISTKSTQKLLSGFSASMQTAFQGISNEDTSKERVKSVEKEIEAIKKQYRKGELDRGEYLQRLSQLDDDRKKAVAEARENEFTIGKAFQQSMTEAFAGVNETVSASLQNVIAEYDLINTTIVDLEKQKNEAMLNSHTAMLEGKIEEWEKYNAEYERLNGLQAKSAERASELISQAYNMAAFSAASSLGMMLAQGKSLLKSTVLAALDALQALVPIFAAQIVGGQLANPNPVNIFGFMVPGTIAAAAAIATMTAGVQVAKAAVNKMNFKTGGYNPHGFGGLSGYQSGIKQINIVEDGRPEFIHNANSTSKNLHHYKALNASNEDLVKYAVRLPEVRNQILAEMTNAMGTNQNEFVKVIKEFNANANARKTSKVNVDAKINVDSSRMIKEVEFKSYQEARR